MKAVRYVCCYTVDRTTIQNRQMRVGGGRGGGNNNTQKCPRIPADLHLRMVSRLRHCTRELASSKSRSGQQAPVVCTENTGLCRASVVCTEIRGLCRAPVVWGQTSEIPNVHVYGTRARVILGRA